MFIKNEHLKSGTRGEARALGLLVSLEEASERAILSITVWDRTSSNIKILTSRYTLLFRNVQNTFGVISTITSLGSQYDSLSWPGRGAGNGVVDGKWSPAGPAPSCCVLWEKNHMKLREEACDLRTSTCTRPQMLVFCSKSGVSPIFHRVCCEASHSSQSLKPTLTPHLLCLSSLSANDLASFSQRKCRETSLSPTYTLTCDYNHPTLLLEERSQCPVQTNPSHMC